MKTKKRLTKTDRRKMMRDSKLLLCVVNSKLLRNCISPKEAHIREFYGQFEPVVKTEKRRIIRFSMAASIDFVPDKIIIETSHDKKKWREHTDGKLDRFFRVAFVRFPRINHGKIKVGF